MNNEKQQLETIKVVGKHGNCIDISVKVPDDPKPQTIVYPSFIKEVMMIVCISFVIIIGLVFFTI